MGLLQSYVSVLSAYGSLFFLVSCGMLPGIFQSGKEENPPAVLSIRAYAEPAVVHVGETVTLTVEVTSEGGSAGEPVMESEPEGFQIISRSKAVSVSIINGRKKNSSTLQLILLALQPGNFRLPSFRIGDSVSESAEITVKPGKPGTEIAPRNRPAPPAPQKKGVTQETLI